MIRKFADRTEWGRIVDKHFTVMSKKTIGFSGYVTLFEIRKVTEPVFKRYEKKDVCLAATGYKWLQLFPEYANYTLTSIYNEHSRLILRHLEICKCQGVTDAGVPWYDNLFLTLDILPSGELYVMQEDHLRQALERGEIGKDDYELAWATANHVMKEYRSGSFDLLLMADKHLHDLVEV